MVHRINVFLLCFFIAYAPTQVFAAFETIKFLDAVENVRKIAGGAVADFRFKDSAGKGYSALGRTVSSQQLASVARKRILCGTLVTMIACGVGVSALVEYLEDDGWTVDVANDRIYKEEVGEIWMNTYDGSGGTKRYDSAANACKATSLPNNWSFSHAAPNSDPNKAGCMVLNSSNQTTLNHYVNKVASAPTQREITDDEIAQAIDEGVEVPDLRDLLTSPDYEAEPHAPLASAAEDAQPDDKGCSAGMKFDAEKGECVPDTATTTTDPETGEQKTEWPTFCNWAKSICEYLDFAKPKVTTITDNTTKIATEADKQTKQDKDFYDWMQSENPPPQSPNNAVTVTSQEAGHYGLDLPTVFTSTRFQVPDTCPQVDPLSFNLMGVSYSVNMTLQPVCNFVSMLRPAIIVCGYIYAAQIVINSARV